MEAGHPALKKAAKATVHRILAEQPLHPEKINVILGASAVEHFQLTERHRVDFRAEFLNVLDHDNLGQ